MPRILICTLGLFVLTFATSALARDPLVGSWKIMVTPGEDARRAGMRPYEDVVTFKGSLFVSQVMRKQGFEPVEYDEFVRRGPVARFTAKPTSKTHGKAEWTGNATAADMQGELVWTRPDESVLRFTFKGRRE